MRDLTALYKLLDSVVSLFDKLLAVETEKLDAIAVNDVEKLDEYMLSEQALTMELRSLDAKREKEQSVLGFENFTLNSIIQAVDGDSPDDAAKLKDLMETLEQKTDELTVAVACTRKFIELHLQSIDFVLAKMGEQREKEGSYQSSGEKSEQDSRPTQFTPRKV